MNQRFAIFTLSSNTFTIIFGLMQLSMLMVIISDNSNLAGRLMQPDMFEQGKKIAGFTLLYVLSDISNLM